LTQLGAIAPQLFSPYRKSVGRASAMLAPRRLLWLALAAATLCTAAAVVHDEAPIVSVNGTFNTHFLAHITDLQPGACVIFEAQVWPSSAFRSHSQEMSPDQTGDCRPFGL